MTRRAFGALVLLAFAAASASAQIAPPPTPSPASGKRSSGPAKPPRAPIDFSGTWEIDAAKSTGVSANMQGAVIAIRQNGDHIWIEPVDRSRKFLSSEEIVVDGRLYEKAVGRGMKGTVQAQWAKDKKSLWIQTVTKDEEGTQVFYQRTEWRLEEPNTWTRGTRTVQKDGVRDSFLVFHRQTAAPAP